MTVDEAKSAKKQMEATILALIQTFEQESGMCVASVTVFHDREIGKQQHTLAVETGAVL